MSFLCPFRPMNNSGICFKNSCYVLLMGWPRGETERHWPVTSIMALCKTNMLSQSSYDFKRSIQGNTLGYFHWHLAYAMSFHVMWPKSRYRVVVKRIFTFILVHWVHEMDEFEKLDFICAFLPATITLRHKSWNHTQPLSLLIICH